MQNLFVKPNGSDPLPLSSALATRFYRAAKKKDTNGNANGANGARFYRAAEKKIPMAMPVVSIELVIA